MAVDDTLAVAFADRRVQHVHIDGAAFTALWCDDGEWLLVPTIKNIAPTMVRVTPEQLEAWRD